MKKLLFLLLFLVTLVPFTSFAQTIEPTLTNCMRDGGYDPATNKWNAIPSCEPQRLPICKSHFNVSAARTWRAFLRTYLGRQYNCADFAAQQKTTTSYTVPTETTIDNCLAASYQTDDWNRLNCNTIRLELCKQIYVNTGKDLDVYTAETGDAGHFHCFDYPKALTTGIAEPDSGNSGGNTVTGGSGTSPATTVQTCASFQFLSQPWLQANCRNVEREKVDAYCKTLSPATNDYRLLNCIEFQVAPGTIGSGTQNTNPFGVSGISTTTSSGTVTSSVGANCSAKFKSLTDALFWVRCIVGILIPLGLSIAFIVFVWNIIRYVIAPNPTKDNERRKYIVAAIIGLFVLVTVWGIVGFVSNTFGLGFVVPQLPTK